MKRRTKSPRSTLELLFRAARLVNERAVASARQDGANPLRLAHTQLFPHITFDGVRITTIAKRLEVSKQAIGPLVDELVDEGLVERIPDPSDARAKLVRWTRRGGEALRHGLRVLERLENQLAGRIGRARMDALGETLERLIAVVDAPGSRDQ